MQIINFLSTATYYSVSKYYSRQLLLIQFTKINRIVFFAFFVVLIVFLAHTISYSNIALEGKQLQQQQRQQLRQNSTIFNVKITYPPTLQQAYYVSDVTGIIERKYINTFNMNQQ